MRVTSCKQQQQLVLSLAQVGGVSGGLFGLPDAQAELKPLSGGLLRQACGQMEFTDVGTGNNGGIYRLISRGYFLQRCGPFRASSVKNDAENDRTVITLS
ncbi:hypothetical protein ACJ2_28010 [Pantoea sp. QMID2]|nr:hypothetical protein ACJ1_27150 [Pantoea sp. QMID1]GME42937.1 hypothetical protein ACJ3_31610 [Pantoea sp. QMID3]GME56675.1 hypothetical protein ACJ4_23650 [Pantoea sp. QMID4]GME59203.1 hypothetical protein ACJ2_28010 [Pantoea sp. QMID2]